MKELQTVVGHTPGPWRLRESSDEMPWIIEGADAFPVALLTGLRQPARANACLIAAAPELLTAVGSALWVFNNLHNVTKDPEQFIRFAEAAASDCRKAYDKAEGRTDA